MKKLSNPILPIILICSLILLAGCFSPVSDTTEFVVQGRIMVPDSSAKDITGWVPLPNTTVTITDSEGITHTVTTDSEGYYYFSELSPGSNYIITATGQIGENTIIVKDIIPLVEEGETYNAGTADCESTALSLAVEALVAEGLTLQEIDLIQIQNTSHFANLVSTVCLVLEENGNVTTDPDINDQLEEVVEEIIPPPSPSPSPPAASTDATLSNLVLSEGTLDPTFDSATEGYTAQVENDKTSITVTPTASDSNASIKVNNVSVASGSPSGAISIDVGENTITIIVTAEDGTTTKTYTVTVTRLGSSAKEIIYFYFDEDDDPAFDDYIDGEINSTLHTVSLTVPYGTIITDLTAYFELSDGASATVGGTPQESGVTANDFSSPVTYTITAEDGSTQEWEVTVRMETTTDIVEYEFREADNSALSYDVEGTIDYDNHTVSLSVLYGTRESLIATFELATGATSAEIGTVLQESGVTANNFTLPVTYTITAEDSITTQDWTVTVGEETVRYVATTGNDSNDGSETSPWLTIQHALDIAPDLCTIIVKDDGPYNETINPPSTSDTDGGRLIILKSATGSTIINGESGACTVGMYGCPEGTTMEGFIITHATGIYGKVHGKGMYISDESWVSINNCTISDNEITSNDAGIWISGDNNVTLNDCTISNNITSESVGGIYNNGTLTLNNCTISGNQANGGKAGGIENTGTITIDGGTISNNSASTSGGGIYQSSGSMTVQGCTISSNEAVNSFSAGICLVGGSSNIGGSGADMNTICGNYITGYSPTLDDQIGDGVSSLYGTYESTNNISVTCP
jgi:parallel beta-helix repeat protein